MLTLEETGWGLCGNSLYYLCNFSVSLNYAKIKSLLKKFCTSQRSQKNQASIQVQVCPWLLSSFLSENTCSWSWIYIYFKGLFSSLVKNPHSQKQQVKNKCLTLSCSIWKVIIKPVSGTDSNHWTHRLIWDSIPRHRIIITMILIQQPWLRNPVGLIIVAQSRQGWLLSMVILC